jgi:hypothetical protein
MKLLLAALLTVLFADGCASSKSEFVPYRACLTNPARNYFRPGTVVAEYFDEDTERKMYVFQADDHPRDGKHLLRVTRVMRPCAIAEMWDPIKQEKR